MTPRRGYYATRDPFGQGGDFITAPEISQMFGEILGLWCGQAWVDQGCPKNTRLVELGPGRGTLMADALRAFKRVPGFLAEVELVLVEASPTLRDMQAEKSQGQRRAHPLEFAFRRQPDDRRCCCSPMNSSTPCRSANM